MSSARKNPDNIQTVDIGKHRNLRVKLDATFPHAQIQHFVPITLSELALSASNYPVAFVQRPADGKYMLTAILGLRPGENAFHGAESWDRTHVPLIIQRHPFIVGYDDNAPDSDQLKTCIETDSPYVSETDGIALYTDAGEETDFLVSRHQILGTIFESQKVTDRFIQALTELDLIIPITLMLQQQNGDVRTVTGLSTLDEVKMRSLTADQLKSLHDNDFLAPSYVMLVSLHQLNHLIQLRNRKGLEQVVNFQVEFNKPPAAAQ